MPELEAGHLQMRQRVLLAGLAGHDITVLHCGSDGRCDMAEGLPPFWPAAPVGRAWTDGLPPDVVSIIEQATERLGETGTAQTAEFHLGLGRERRTLVASFVPDDDGIIAVINDVTEARQREQAFTALLREVSHRSKNLLAIVQSVAMQTANHAGTVNEFLDKFRGRLHALSSTQDLVTESDWRGASLQTLIEAQLRRVQPRAAGALVAKGINPTLTPNAALHVGLAIHELAANAAAHGALSGSLGGDLTVEAFMQDGRLVLEWNEAFGERAERAEPGFGAMILERIVPLSVGGEARYALGPTSVCYRLEIPGDELAV